MSLSTLCFGFCTGPAPCTARGPTHRLCAICKGTAGTAQKWDGEGAGGEMPSLGLPARCCLGEVSGCSSLGAALDEVRGTGEIQALWPQKPSSPLPEPRVSAGRSVLATHLQRRRSNPCTYRRGSPGPALRSEGIPVTSRVLPGLDRALLCSPGYLNKSVGILSVTPQFSPCRQGPQGHAVGCTDGECVSHSAAPRPGRMGTEG